MRKLTVFAATLLAAAPALGHPGHEEVTGVADVLMHPFGEFGHLLVLAAVVMLAVMLKEPARRWHAKAISRRRRRG